MATQEMAIDSVLAEVRQAREALAERFNFDLRAISADARKRQQASGRRVVSLPPRPATYVRSVVIDYKGAFDALIQDPRYQRNLDWGQSRPGHPEGTVRAHIQEIERNLEALRTRLSETDYWKLKLLIHSHDSFKAEAQRGVAITDPKSHASLAREFLATHCSDPDLLAMVQYHDEPFALWRQFDAKGKHNEERFAALLRNIKDWNLFLAFNIVDGCTEGKGREPLVWLFKEVNGRVQSSFSAADIL
jgi:hypothetical protein